MEGSGLEWPRRGNPAAEEFRVTEPMKMFLRGSLAWVPMWVVFFAFTLFLGTILAAGNPIVGLVIAAAATGMMIWQLYRKAENGWLSTVVRMSPVGVELWDDAGFHLWLPWPGITRVGQVATPRAKPGTSVDLAIGSLRVAAWRNLGLIGWGDRRVPDNMPPWMATVLDEAPRHPDSGAIEVAIPLGSINPAWPHTAMGGWVRRHRPDLLPDTTGRR
jgi:hypothetical protein